MKNTIFACMMIMLMLASACGNVEMKSNPNNFSQSQPEMDESLIPKNKSECVNAELISLDSETEKYFYGTWKVEKHLGFANSYNDASEYPTGQKYIGDNIIVEKDIFSSKGLKKYKKYQYELKNPLYQITATCYNSDSFYRLYKILIPGIDINDEIKAIVIRDPSTKMGIPAGLSFFVINNDRLILLSEATIFELEKITN